MRDAELKDTVTLHVERATGALKCAKQRAQVCAPLACVDKAKSRLEQEPFSCFFCVSQERLTLEVKV